MHLSIDGINEIIALVNYWSKSGTTFDLILSSPLSRTLETARIVAEGLKVPLEIDNVLIARSFGDAEGVDLNKVYHWYEGRVYPTQFEPIFETGESEWEVHTRASTAIQSFFKRPPGKYLIVSHGNFINAALHVILGTLPLGRSLPIELALANSGYADLSFDVTAGRWRLKSFNNMEHLG